MKKFAILFAVVSAVVMLEASASACKVYTCTSIDSKGGVLNRGKGQFGLNEKITFVIEGYPLFCAETEIQVLDCKWKKLTTYTRNMPGGGGRQWTCLTVDARWLPPSDYYIARFFFRGCHVGDVAFLVKR